MSTTDNPEGPSSTSPANPISLRPPTSSLSNTPKPTNFVPPSHAWLEGKWYVTHSSLPLWKDKRNVTIAYELLAEGKIRDTTAYQAGSAGSKVKTISGINTPPPNNPGAFDWRGTGWLKIATSHWELLGWGNVEEDGDKRWVVTYFSKTLFTPAGIDIYSRQREGLPADAVEGIKKALEGLEAEEVRKLVGEVFEVKHDDEEH